MGEHVKRVYRQSARAMTSQQTRRAIVEAAVSLFVAQGYGATTVDEIAERAGVGRRTVFRSVGGKLAALRVALDWAVTGDDEDVALQDRATVRRMAAERDPVRLVAMWAELTTQICARLAPLSRILSAASDREPDLRELRSQGQTQRLAGQHAFARYLNQLGALNPKLTVKTTADELWMFSDPVLFDRLVHDRGWTQTHFQTWLARTVTVNILVHGGQ
jgi:AcrR family transcriptional regulator